MRENKKHSLPILSTVRSHLRGTLTPAEAYLWNALKGSKLQGRKFRRQHSIESFIVDFCCPSEKLIIQLDGEVHNNPSALHADVERDARLRELGYTVLRFENRVVFDALDGVLLRISSHFT